MRRMMVKVCVLAAALGAFLALAAPGIASASSYWRPAPVNVTMSVSVNDASLDAYATVSLSD